LLNSPKVYSASWEFGPGSFMDGFDMSVPISVEVDASPGFAYVPVDISVDSTMVPAAFLTLEEYYGYIQFTNTTDISDTLRVPFYAVPQPYSQLAVTDSSQMGFSGLLELANSGPRSSSLWAYPLYDQDGNEPGIGDAADLRMFGMDYGGTHPTYGPLIVPAFNVFGSWHTPQPYFAEFDLYLDVDQDGYNTPDFVDFNWNLGWLNGLDDNDVWVVIQVNLLTEVVDLSPFTPTTTAGIWNGTWRPYGTTWTQLQTPILTTSCIVSTTTGTPKWAIRDISIIPAHPSAGIYRTIPARERALTCRSG